MAVGTIAHGKSGTIAFTSLGAAGLGTYITNVFDASVELSNNVSEVTTFDTTLHFKDSIPGKTTASGSFSVYVDDETSMGLGDMHFDVSSYPGPLIVDVGATTITMSAVQINGISVTQDPNGVPAFACSYVCVGTLTSA